MPRTPPVGDAAITADLMTRLRRHYIKPGADLPGGVFLHEVGQNGAWGASQRVDALYVGFTGASGRLLVGHEVKASRSDWLTELGKPGKADVWADQCHEWWLVTIPGVVRDGELPEGWGLMHPGRSTTRMEIVTPARRYPDRQPSWDAVRSIIARQDTLRADAIHEGKMKARENYYADLQAEVERRVAIATRQPSPEDALAIREENRAVLAMFGLERYPYGDGYRLTDGVAKITAEEVADVAALLRHAVPLAHARRSLVDRYESTHLHTIERSMGELRAAQAALAAEIGTTLEENQ